MSFQNYATLEMYAGILYDLCNESALAITETDMFAKVYSLVR